MTTKNKKTISKDTMVTVSKSYEPISSRPASSQPSMSSSTPIEILPATEADCLAIADIESLAFERDPMTQATFGPRDIGALPKRSAQLQELITVDPTVRFFKAVVDGQIVAAAQWHIRTDPEWHLPNLERSEGEFVKGVDVPTSWPPGANASALNDFFGWIYGVRKRRMGGKKHILLALLVTRPDFQGKGAGSALVKHGLAVADELDLPAWLEASPMGYPVYKKLGFEDVEPHVTDLKKYGGDEVSRAVGMLRPAKSDRALA